MATEGDAYRYPFTPYAGSSTPSSDVPPSEGKRDLWTFFWLSIANTGIIAVTGIVTWWLVNQP